MPTPREYAVAFESKSPGKYPSRIVFRVWAYDVMDAAQSGAVLLSNKYPGASHVISEVSPPMDVVLSTTEGNKADMQVAKLMDSIKATMKDKAKGE